MKCTWENCNEKATFEEKRSDGSIWADLCDVHHKELEDAIEQLDVKKLLRAWIQALGGPKEAAMTMR